MAIFKQEKFKKFRWSPQQKELTYQILKTLGMGAVLTLAVVAPNAVQVLKYFTNMKKPVPRRSFDPQKVYSVLKKINQKGWVEINEVKDKMMVTLTKEGKREILKYDLDQMKIKPLKKWDGYWRIVIFDIPERFKKGRNAFRALLRRLGFYRLQKSVFILPWQCEREIEFISHVYQISSYVNFILAKKIKNDQILKTTFNLNL